jgi:hypothetical protein
MIEVLADSKRRFGRRSRLTPNAIFGHMLKEAGLRGWLDEYRFHPTRKWRFDWANPAVRLAVEIQGVARGGVGAHSYASGMERDYEKYNQAVAMGWRLIFGTVRMAEDGRLLAAVKAAL